MNSYQASIHEWETAEVERSANEAARRTADDLAIPNAIIQRYLTPPKSTNYALEYAYFLLGDVSGKRVLDYGCGTGENSVLIASHGGKVVGIDISSDLLAMAENRMYRHKYEGHEFKVGSAHDLPLPDESVDIVFGIAILHHLDLSLASREVFRVLKKGGRAVFLEPVRDSELMWFIRRLIPYQQADISPFERPLTSPELRDFGTPFSTGRNRFFSLPFVNLIETLGLSEKLLHLSIRVDGRVLQLHPTLKRYASVRVFELLKPE